MKNSARVLQSHDAAALPRLHGVATLQSTRNDATARSMTLIFTLRDVTQTMTLRLAGSVTSHVGRWAIAFGRRLVIAIHESRERRAAALIARYRHLMADDLAASVFQSKDIRRDEAKAPHAPPRAERGRAAK